MERTPPPAAKWPRWERRSVETAGIQHLKQSSFKGNACFAPSFSFFHWGAMNSTASRNSEGTPGMSALSGQKGPGRLTLNAEAVWEGWLSRRLNIQSHDSPGKSMTWDRQGTHGCWSLCRAGQGSASSSAPGDPELMSNLPGELSGQWFGWGCSLSILSKLCHSAERNSWSQRKDTRELGHTGVRAGWREGLSVLLLYLCEINPPSALCRAILLLPSCLLLYQWGVTINHCPISRDVTTRSFHSLTKWISSKLRLRKTFQHTRGKKK